MGVVGPAHEAPAFLVSLFHAAGGVPCLWSHVQTPHQHEVLVVTPTALTPTTHTKDSRAAVRMRRRQPEQRAP